MKLPKLEQDKIRWDRYRAFHVGLDPQQVATETYTWPPLIVFDDGQVMCTMSEPKPEARRHYPALNITLVAANDPNCPKMTLPDGTAVPKAWLMAGGQRYMLIDHDSGHVVQLAGNTYNDPLDTKLPEQAVRTAKAWFAGEGALPVGVPVKIAMPDKLSMTKEEREHIDTLVCAFRAEVTLIGDEHVVNTTGKPRNYWDRDTPLDPQRLLDVSSASELEPREQGRLFRVGLARRVKEYPYLLLAE
jgi:hypothetical protein